MLRVVHFEISADDPERASKFYTEVFGWKFNKWEGPQPYWLVETGPKDQPGINGGMFVRKGQVGHVNTVEVPDVDEYVAKIVAAGGECVLPKMAIPGVGWLAYCKDTEGSVFGLHHHDPSAK